MPTTYAALLIRENHLQHELRAGERIIVTHPASDKAVKQRSKHAATRHRDGITMDDAAENQVAQTVQRFHTGGIDDLIHARLFCELLFFYRTQGM